MTIHPPGRRSRIHREERGYRRALAWGTVASAVLHVGVLLVLPAVTLPGSGPGQESTSRPGPPDAIRAVSIRSPVPTGGPAPARSELAEALPEPTRPRISEVRTEPVRVEIPVARWASAAGEGSSGVGLSAGQGAAGSGGAGGDGRFSPPVPRSLVPDWSPPDEVRGHRVTIRVEVDATGRPTGRVELAPPTPSDEFNRRLRKRMASLEFRPARRDGRPVTAWAEITFTF